MLAMLCHAMLCHAMPHRDETWALSKTPIRSLARNASRRASTRLLCRHRLSRKHFALTTYVSSKVHTQPVSPQSQLHHRRRHQQHPKVNQSSYNILVHARVSGSLLVAQTKKKAHPPWSGVDGRRDAALVQVRGEDGVVEPQEQLQQHQVCLEDHERSPSSRFSVLGSRREHVGHEAVNEGAETPFQPVGRGGERSTGERDSGRGNRIESSLEHEGEDLDQTRKPGNGDGRTDVIVFSVGVGVGLSRPSAPCRKRRVGLIDSKRRQRSVPAST